METFASHLLVRRIDHGGRAEHYEARDPAGETRLLVRSRGGPVWEPWADPALASVVDHPNVVRLHASHAFAAEPYFAFEWVPGLDLRELLARGPLPPDVACLIVRDAAAGLAHARSVIAPDGREVEILHDGLYPRMIRLTPRGEVKVSGFGTGGLKPERSHASSTMLLDERLRYAAPEEVSLRACTAAANVFSLGAILHRLMTREELFNVEDPIGWVRALCGGQAASFSRFSSDRPSDELARTLDRMLTADPTRRIPHAGEVERRLRGVPELAREEPTRRSLAELVARAVSN